MSLVSAVWGHAVKGSGQVGRSGQRVYEVIGWLVDGREDSKRPCTERQREREK